MRILEARNVNQALPKALLLLHREGVRRDSRNGPVIVMPTPVTTVYDRPQERVVFWAARDANPFFHLYEAMWMLAGRNDVQALTRYASNMANFSDDGETQHGAYGYRWRQSFGKDQLRIIADALIANPDDRRNVLQMWDTRLDLGHRGKDVPCNVTATVQVNAEGAVDLCVFNRSNDIIWGCYGANAVHFSMLQEYLAGWLDRPMGGYWQISTNWHAYDNELYQRVGPLRSFAQATRAEEWDVYAASGVTSVPLLAVRGPIAVAEFDWQLARFFDDEARDFKVYTGGRIRFPFIDLLYTVFSAHAAYRRHTGEERYTEALTLLHAAADPSVDWLVACRQWLERRYSAWKQRHG